MKKKFFDNTWESVEILGKGSFGTVYKARKIDSDLEVYSAIKEITIPNNLEDISTLKTEGFTKKNIDDELESQVENLKKEIKSLYKFKDSSNIVNIEDYKVETEDIENNLCSKTYKVYIRMELLESITSLFLKDELTDKEVLKLGIDIASALDELEEEKFIHRDIKPENIFVNKKGVYKLGDFGEAKQLNSTISNVSVKGTEQYMAPELLSAKKIDKTVDIYSLGIVLYRFFNNKKFPFYPNDGETLTARLREEARYKRYSGEELPKPVNASDEVADIILKMCAYKKEDRYQNASELKSDLESVLANIKRTKNIFTLDNENTDLDDEEDDEYNKTISLYARRKKAKQVEEEKKEEVFEAKEESKKEEKINENTETILEEDKIDDFTSENNEPIQENHSNSQSIGKKIGIAACIIVGLIILFLIAESTGNKNVASNKIKKDIETGFVEIKATEISEKSSDNTILLYMGRENCNYCQMFEPKLKKMQEKSKNFTIYYLDMAKIYNYVTGDISDSNAIEILKNLKKCSYSLKDSSEYLGSTPVTLLIKNNTVYGVMLGYTDDDESIEKFILQGFEKDNPKCG